MLKYVFWAWLLPVGLALLVLAVACGSDPENDGESGAGSIAGASSRVVVEGGAYSQIEPQTLEAMLQNKDFLLVNVHVPYEGEIEGTDLFIPYDQIAERISELPSNVASRIVLYCRSGRMSAIAAETLVNEGYTNVWDLHGGMIAWQDAGYTVLEAGQPQ